NNYASVLSRGSRRALRQIPFVATALFVLLNSARIEAIPAHIYISGTLTDGNGRPPMFKDEQGRTTEPKLAAHIQFFSSDTNQLVAADILTTTSQVIEGVFNIPVLLTDELLALDQLWYSLAIDADRNGLDSNDQFEGRFRIVSVPFALTAKPVKFFDTQPI